jgi:hypothetical protein
LLCGGAEGVERFERFFRRGEVDVDHRFAARRIAEASPQNIGKNVRHVGVEQLDCGIHGAANRARAKRADRFVNRDDAADFGGVRLIVAEHLELRIDHFEARWAELIDFGFAVKDELLARLEAAFEITSVKKLAGEQAAGGVLHEQMIDGVVTKFVGNGLAAHDARANGVRAGRLDVANIRKMNAVFVSEGEIGEQVFKSINAALREQLGALRADALNHAHFGGRVQCH